MKMEKFLSFRPNILFSFFHVQNLETSTNTLKKSTSHAEQMNSTSSDQSKTTTKPARSSSPSPSNASSASYASAPSEGVKSTHSAGQPKFGKTNLLLCIL